MSSPADEPTLIPPEPEQSDALLEEGLAPPPEADELPTITVGEDDPPPLGRSYVMDFGREQFVRSRGVPSVVTGVQNLLAWIDKCLHTAQGALDIHPPEYGLREPDRFFGRPVDQLSAQEMEEDFRDALTFHPRIADVTDLQLHTDEQTGMAFATYSIVTDPPTDEVELLSIRTSLGAGI